jgi:prevent-host-death family protein
VDTTKAISRTDLARRTRQVVDRVRRGETVIVQSYGEEEAVIVDILNYRILRAMTAYESLPPHSAPVHDAVLIPHGLENQELEKALAAAGGDVQAIWNLVIATYLDGNISLGRAAQLLRLSRFELVQRFNRLGIPLRLGPATLEEAKGEFEAIREKA